MSVSDEAYSLAERKALALKKVFDLMPVHIGAKELIVGTRTFFAANEGNEDGHDIFQYNPYTYVPYINKEDIALFGCDQSYSNRTHFTPDFSIILEKGIDGMMMATPEGRKAGSPVAVTLTPESGTMKKGPTAVLRSAAKFDPMLIQWNFCVMVNYFSSIFQGEGGKEIFKSLLSTYFRAGGLQHQPNISDVETLRRAQAEPEKYKDLIVRLWGVSAHFSDLPKELQDEIIARFG